MKKDRQRERARENENGGVGWVEGGGDVHVSYCLTQYSLFQGHMRDVFRKSHAVFFFVVVSEPRVVKLVI